MLQKIVVMTIILQSRSTADCMFVRSGFCSTSMASSMARNLKLVYGSKNDSSSAGTTDMLDMHLDELDDLDM